MYSTKIRAESRKTGEPHEGSTPALDILGKRIFIGSSDHGLYSLDARDGSTLWRYETGGPVRAQPIYDPRRNRVYFGSHDGALYALDADTGRLKFRFSTNAEIQRAPVLRGDRLYAVNANDTVMAIDAEDGKLLWHQHRTPAMGLEIVGYSGPMVRGGRVYVGFSDGTVAAYDARTGEPVWQPVDLAREAEQVLGELPTFLDVDTTPVYAQTEAGPAVVVANYAAGVFALDVETGVQLWANTGVRGVTDLTMWHEPEHLPRGAKPGSLTVPEKALLVANTGTDGLFALDPLTGTIQWSRPVPQGFVSKPVSTLGVLLVATSKLGLFVISPLDGSLIDGLHLADGIGAAPAAFGSRVFALTNEGRFLGLHLAPPR